LESTIIFRRQRPGEILPPRGKIFAEDETGLEAMTLDRQIIEEATKAEQIIGAGSVAQGRILFT